jgi:hypothetical protein
MNNKKLTANNSKFFLKTRLGYAARIGVRHRVLIARALEADGKRRASGQSDRQFANAHFAYIVEQNANAKREHPRLFDAEKPARRTAKGASKAPPHGSYHGDVNGPEFLSSYQWRTLRMKVLTHYGPKCMCCGATPQTGAVMNIDHIKPRRTHPHLALDFENLQVLCHECNHGKSNWDTTDWRPVAEEPIDPDVAAFIRSIARES